MAVSVFQFSPESYFPHLSLKVLEDHHGFDDRNLDEWSSESHVDPFSQSTDKFRSYKLDPNKKYKEGSVDMLKKTPETGKVSSAPTPSSSSEISDRAKRVAQKRRERLESLANSKAPTLDQQKETLARVQKDWTINGVTPVVSKSPYKITEAERKEDLDREYIDQFEHFLGLAGGPPVPVKQPKEKVKLKVTSGRAPRACNKCNEQGLVWGEATNGKFVLCHPLTHYAHECKGIVC